MTTLDSWLGGATRQDLTGASGEFRLHKGFRAFRFLADTAPFYLKLPDARDLQTGGPHWLVMNESASTIGLFFRDSGRIILPYSLDPGRAHLIYLIDNSTVSGEWSFSISPGHGVFTGDS